MTEESPALYVVPTPLGNLSDMTPRAVEVLRRVAWVACEDTRHSAPLLRHFGASARLLAAHEHNEEAAAQQVVARLDEGEYGLCLECEEEIPLRRLEVDPAALFCIDCATRRERR